MSALLLFSPFFALGWVMFPARESTGVLQRRTWWMLPVAAALALSIFTNAIHCQPIGVVLSALVAWLTVVGLMGIALRPATTRSPGLLAQSAHWVYLVHHPLVQGAQVLVAPLEWPGTVDISASPETPSRSGASCSK